MKQWTIRDGHRPATRLADILGRIRRPVPDLAFLLAVLFKIPPKLIKLRKKKKKKNHWQTMNWPIPILCKWHMVATRPDILERIRSARHGAFAFSLFSQCAPCQSWSYGINFSESFPSLFSSLGFSSLLEWAWIVSTCPHVNTSTTYIYIYIIHIIYK